MGWLRDVEGWLWEVQGWLWTNAARAVVQCSKYDWCATPHCYPTVVMLLVLPRKTPLVCARLAGNSCLVWRSDACSGLTQRAPASGTIEESEISYMQLRPRVTSAQATSACSGAFLLLQC